MEQQETAHTVSSEYLHAKKVMEEFFQSHLDAWLKLQLERGKLKPNALNQDYAFEEETKDGFVFSCPDWVETWRYDGREEFWGVTVTIPHDFFDNPGKYEDEAVEEKRLKEKAAERAARKRTHNDITRLHHEIEKLEERLNK